MVIGQACMLVPAYACMRRCAHSCTHTCVLMCVHVCYKWVGCVHGYVCACTVSNVSLMIGPECRRSRLQPARVSRLTITGHRFTYAYLCAAYTQIQVVNSDMEYQTVMTQHSRLLQSTVKHSVAKHGTSMAQQSSASCHIAHHRTAPHRTISHDIASAQMASWGHQSRGLVNLRCIIVLNSLIYTYDYCLGQWSATYV